MKKVILLIVLTLFFFAVNSQAQKIIFVNAAATGSNNGTSWADAFTDFQAGVNTAVAGDSVFVAKGTYQPASGQSFSMKAGVKIYGSFAGTETSLSQRGSKADPTSILQGNGTSVIQNINNGLDTSALLDEFKITGGSSNSQSVLGGGIYNSNSSPMLTNVTISGNSASQGAGIYNQNCNPMLINVIISGNSASQGAGIYNLISNPTLTNVTISGNSVGNDGQGAGIYNNNSNPILTNVTISGNSAEPSGEGGGIYNQDSYPVIVNSIIYGNSADTDPGIYGSGSVITYSLVQGMAASPANHVLDGSLNPMFVNATNGNFQLQFISPVINEGINDSLPAGDTIDLAGNPRIYDKTNGGIVDLGAFEYQGNPIAAIHPDANGIVYVDSAAAPGGDGSSWNKALPQFADALVATDSLNKISPGTVKQIWVARGTYKPLFAPEGGYAYENGDSINISALPFVKSFVLPDSIKIYGGFAGNEASLSDRDTSKLFTANKTILSGTLITDTLKALHVIIAVNVDSVLLDGFTVTGGYAQVPERYLKVNGQKVSLSDGGGIFSTHSSLKLTNIHITGNAAFNGGGIANENHSSVTLNNATISGNMVGYDGGGIYNNHSSATLTDGAINNNKSGSPPGTPSNGGGIASEHHSSLTLTDVTINGNVVVASGGGVYNADTSSATLMNVSMMENNAEGEGGGMCNDSSAVSRLYNVTISSNIAFKNGGGLYNQFSSPALTNVIISGNVDSNTGGGIYNVNQASPTLTNCIIYDNSSGIADSAGSHTTVTYSLVQGIAADPANHILDSTLNPMFVDAANGNFQLQAGSPVINKGINDSLPAWDSTDLANNPRIYDKANGGIVDLGAYEYQGNPTVTIHPDANGIMYVDSAAAPGGDGSSWDKALKYLSDATKAANEDSAVIKAIHVAKGTYYPTGLQSDTTRDSTFAIIRGGLKLYGGYPTGGGTRNITANSTVLSGNIGSAAIDSDNSYHVMVIAGVPSSADSVVVDGFTITGGYASSQTTATNNINGISIPTTLGGGMIVYQTGKTTAIRNCKFYENNAVDGGGMANYGASPRVMHCTFMENHASVGGGTGGGGGMANENSHVVVVNCLFTGNVALLASAIVNAGLTNSSFIERFINCTITGNKGTLFNSISAQRHEGTMMNEGYTTADISNCLIEGNSSGVLDTLNAASFITYSLVQGMAADSANHILDSTLNPMFVDTANGNYQLQSTSPVINKGINDSLPADDTLDLAGNPRIYDKANGGIVDMGAYEFQGNPAVAIHPDAHGIMYVDSAAAPGGDGSSWAKALQSFGVAMHAGNSINKSKPVAADSVRQIWVAKGTYQTATGQSFFMLPNVKIYGGFKGNETSLSQRDMKNGDSSILKGNNLSAVISNDQNGLDTSSLLDGFTITGGSGIEEGGGGMENFSASPTIRNCIFSGNSGFSGGAMINMSSSSPLVINCLFTRNEGTSYGGAIVNMGEIDNDRYIFPTPVFINCTISGNSAPSGGAISNSGANPTFINCIIYGNKSGGIVSQDSSSAVIVYSLVEGMAADSAKHILDGSLNPMFVDTTHGNYQLQSPSPVINVGINDSLPAGDTLDLAGNPRIVGGTVEMGAYEYQGKSDSTLVLVKPEDTTVCPNSNVYFKAIAPNAVSPGQWQYTWQYSSDTGKVWASAGINTTPTLGFHVGANPTPNDFQFRVITSGNWGMDTSNVATLHINMPIAITTQPKDSKALAGGDATFSVAATGTVTGYQWQVSSDKGTAWNDVSSATTSVLSLSNLSTIYNGYEYRTVVRGSCENDTSDAAILTINPPELTLNPASLAPGYTGVQYSTVTFSASGGTSPYTYTENGPLPVGLSFVNGVLSGTPTQSGSFSISVKATDNTSSDLGGPFYVIKKYSLVINTGGSCITVVSYPHDTTVCAGSDAGFGITATGATGYQWQSSTDGGQLWTSIQGATKATLSLTNVVFSETPVQYRVIVSSHCGSITSGSATLQVNKAPVITTQPKDTTVCENGTASFFITATGDNLKYQWQSANNGTNWSDVNNGTSGTLLLSNLQPNRTGTQYRVIVSGNCGSVTSVSASLNVRENASIITQPEDTTVAAGHDASFSVTATGTITGYQWQSSENGGTTWNNVSSGTSETLKLSNIGTSSNGFKYRVIVKGTCNNDTSGAARLMVNITIIWSNPGDTLPTGYEHVPYSDSVKATDSTGASPAYTEKGTLPPGLVFDPSTGILSGTPTDTGSYPITITATFPAGSTDTTYSISKNYTVIIDTNGACIHITSQPLNLSLCEGSDTSLTIETTNATGYQWQSSADGTHWNDVNTGTIKTLELSNVQTSQNGTQYRVIVHSACGTVISGSATLTVRAKAAISSQPVSQSVCNGENVTFKVKVTGTNISYQWQSSNDGTNWNNVSDAISNVLKLSNAQVAQTGTKYRVVVGGSCNRVTSNVVTLTVNPLPQVSIVTDSANPVSKGLPVHLTASGADSYQWANGSGIQSGWNEAALSIRPEEDATYTVTGTSAAGCTAQQSYSVQVVTDYKLICNNIITPNGDGKNDTWIIQNIDSYPNNKVMIFDRAGRMIYEKEHYDNQWNGMLNGGPLREGTYYYVFIVDGGKKVFKGFIELLNGKW